MITPDYKQFQNAPAFEINGYKGTVAAYVRTGSGIEYVSTPDFIFVDVAHCEAGGRYTSFGWEPCYTKTYIRTITGVVIDGRLFRPSWDEDGKRLGAYASAMGHLLRIGFSLEESEQFLDGLRHVYAPHV